MKFGDYMFTYTTTRSIIFFYIIERKKIIMHALRNDV